MSKLEAVADCMLSRRTFLKATGALGAATALGLGGPALLKKTNGVANAQAAEGETTVISTWCHGCTTTKTNCAVLCHVDANGKFVAIEGNPDAGNNWGFGCTSLCAKAHSAMQYAYAPNRILYPMKRVGEKGEGKFERITWDEALDTIAAKLKEVKETYGPEAYGWLSPESFPVSALARRFLNVYGSPNYLHSAICATNRSASSQITVGFQSEAPDDWNNSKLIVIWGSNCENSSVNRGKPIQILNAVENGAKLIDIRPMMNPMGSKADIWLGIRPGTDCALALAILNVIITEDLYDFGFVSEWCYGFEQLAEHVQQYTPEWAATVTGLPAEKITDVARMMATIKPTCISTGNGVGDQASDGTATIMAIRLISAITGNIDVPGGIGSSIPVGPSLIPTKGIDSLADRATPEMLEKLGWPEFPRWYQRPGATTSAYFKGMNSILTGEPYPLRAVCGQHTNPFGATRQPKIVAEALKKLDFFFAMDINWNPATAYADIVLPASSLYERDHQFGVFNRAEGTWIGIRNKILEPQGESRSDWQLWLDLAVKMGYGEDFWNGNLDDCWREQLDGSGVTLEELRAAPTGIFVARTEPPPPPTYRKYAQLFEKLPNGKVQCYNERIGGKEDCMGTGTLPYLPEYKGAPESIVNTPDLVAEYPLVLSDVHADRRCQHSSLINLPYLRELQPYPWVRINPATAQKYGIGDGDWMKVESPNGWIKMVAEYFEGIAPDVLMTRRGWWLECEELGLPAYEIGDGGSEVNVMYNTNIDLFDKFASQMPKQTLVKISKA